MDSYGSYETSREIASGPGSAVFAAVKHGESAVQFAIKVVSESAAADDVFAPTHPADAGGNAVDDFLNSVEIQKKAAAASPHIVPVLEAGRDARGAWCVTPLYARSIQSLIAGRVALNSAGVFHLLQNIVAGLLEMKQALGRSHGRLHSGNVLIGSGATMVDAQVHLSDCAPGGTDPVRCELADLHALGILLYQLVRKREVSDEEDWLILPLEASKEWTDLFGASTHAWLEIGNALLDRNQSLERYSLDQLSQALVALQPKPPVSRRALVMVGVVLALVAVGLTYFMWSNKWTTLQVSIVGPGGIDGPDDARVTVDGQPGDSKPTTGTRRQFKLRKNQSYEFAVSHGDLLPFKTNLLVEGKPGQTLALPLIFGRLVVQGVTPGAEFALTNGVTFITGNTTQSYTNPFAKPGLWQLSLKREGFVSGVLETNLEPGQTSVLEAVLKPRAPGKVLVEFLSTPKGATVAVVDADGNTVETVKTGEGISEVKPGKYKLSASYPFWDKPEVQTREFEVMAGQDTSAKFTFGNARLTVACADPPGATLTVSNRLGGGPPATNFTITTPATLPPWPTGTFVFHFEAPGYIPTNLTVTALDGVSTQVMARLIPMLGFAELWTDLPAWITNTVTGECVATNLADRPGVIGFKPENKYTLRATPMGYPGIPPVEIPGLSFEKGMTNRVLFSFAFGRVALTSDPAGAEILDPFSAKAIPITLLSVLPLGTTSLTASHPKYGFDDETRAVTLAKGQTNAVNFEFKYGTVIVTSLPSGLVVQSTNSQPLGLSLGPLPYTTRYTNYFVPYGETSYQLINTNKKVRTVSVKVNARSTFTIGHNFEVPEGYTNGFNMEFEFVPEANIYVDRYELTEAIYAKVMNTNRGVEDLDLPARDFSFSDARRFVAELNKQRPQLPDGELYEYGIPTVAEWSLYAPTNTIGNDVDAILKKGSEPVGNPLPVHRPRTSGPALRLFDLFGNVAEWCEGADGRPNYAGGFYNTPAVVMFSPMAGLRRAAVWPQASEVEAGRNVGLRCVIRRK